MRRRSPPALVALVALVAAGSLLSGCAWWDSLWRDTLSGPYYPLNEAEEQAVTFVFGEGIDTSVIRLAANRTEKQAPARAVGNVIFLRPGEDPEDQALRTSRDHLILVVHEATHIWQYQRGGPDYVVDAVSHNLEALAEKGDRGQAYVYSLTEDLDVLAMRSEPQAKLIEEWYALEVHGVEPFRCLNWGELGRTEFLRRAGPLVRGATQAQLGPDREIP